MRCVGQLKIILVLHFTDYLHMMPMSLQDGWTPLMWAAGRGDENLVKTLLHHGARVNIKTIVRIERIIIIVSKKHYNIKEQMDFFVGEMLTH